MMKSPIFTRYEDNLIRKRRNHSTLDGFRQAVRDFERFCDEAGIDPKRVEAGDVDAWSHSNGFAPTTRRMWWEHVRAAYRLAHDDGIIEKFVFARAEPPKIPERDPRVIPNRELRAIKADCVSDRELLIFTFAAYTGCRFFEMQKMLWSEVRETEYGWEFGFVGKQGKRRTVPIHPELQRVLQAQKTPGLHILEAPGGRMLSQTSWRDALRGVVNGRGGDAPYSFHDFRRTVTTSLYDNGVDDAMTDRIMGWSRQSIRDKHYRRVPAEKLHTAILCLYRNDPL